MRYLIILFFSLIALITSAQKNSGSSTSERQQIATEMREVVQTFLSKWYPQNFDKEYGGYLSSFTYDFKPTGAQDKMIVTQARHLWSNAKASQLYPQNNTYKEGGRHGFQFLRDVLWDKTHGGFYTFFGRDGKPKNDSTKNAYGNAFVIYALAAYYGASKDTGALALAKKTFQWLEQHSHDPVHKGYFQHLEKDGTPIKRSSKTPSTSDLGYKDQNSSIHLLEAFTELYTYWPDPLLKERLQEMQLLIRDRIVTPKGYLILFLQPDWTPLSFRDSTRASILRHRYLDHVSFGHDVETAYLLLEASHVLGKKNDPTTMKVAKRMVDHSLQNGWDKTVGGFYDEGYYFKNASSIEIIRDSKNWWAQVEGLNTLLMMADLYPNDPAQYFEKFKQLWSYINTYLVDHENGDLFEGGLDKEPGRKQGLKGHIWKGNYHQLRSFMNCIQALQTKAIHHQK